MIDRRFFLKSSGLALVAGGLLPNVFVKMASASTTNGKKVLVAIFQRGAVDGLNVVVPYAESAYYAARPSIAAVAESSGDCSETSATVDRRGGICEVARAIGASASADTSCSRSRIAISGYAACREIAYTIPPASALPPRGPAGMATNPNSLHTRAVGTPAAPARAGPS